MNQFRRCPRSHRLKYLENLVPKQKSKEASFGIIWHNLLEKVYKGRDVSDVSLTGLGPYDLAKVRCMLAGYSAYFHDSDMKSMKILAVEQWFDYPLRTATGDPTKRWIKGKIDGIIQIEGKTLILEHKSTKAMIDPASVYWQTLKLQPQAGLYYHVGREMGFNIQGILYNVARVPQLRYRSGESPGLYEARVAQDIIEKPSMYFGRNVYRYTEEEQEQFLMDIWETWELMDTGHAPRYTNNCFFGLNRCEYYPICSGEGTEGFKRNDYVPLRKNSVNPIRGSLGTISSSMHVGGNSETVLFE